MTVSDRHALPTSDLSLGAELLLLAIDPARGGLLPRNRTRFRRALAGAYRSDRASRRGWSPAPGRARRRAVRELKRAGLVEQRWLGHLRLADRAEAAKHFNRLSSCLRDDELSEPRDRVLTLLLAWSGVLAQRLSRDERRIAARRLRPLIRAGQLGEVPGAPTSGQAPAPDWLDALGLVAVGLHGSLIADVISDFGHGDFGGLDSGGFDGARAVSWAGADAADSR